MATRDLVVVAEAAGAAAIVVSVTAIASPHDVWLAGGALHPAWLAVIVIAARYGTRGLLAVLVLTAGALAGASLALQGSLQGLDTRLRGHSDLIALATAIVVAWISMMHATRRARAERLLADAIEARRDAENNVLGLHASLAHLRARLDRLDLALGLWRSLASRMERGDAVEAARAALELCEIRVGARAGVIQRWDGTQVGVRLAARGAWSELDHAAPELDGDATVRAAMLSRRVSPAGAGAHEHDADVAVPITIDDTGEQIGVIALRGVSPSRMHAGELADLGVIAQWLAPALAREHVRLRPLVSTTGG